MANTSAVYARIDTNLKDNAESILSQLGISPSSAIQMLYSQIVLKKGMPFELKLPSSKPLAAERNIYGIFIRTVSLKRQAHQQPKWLRLSLFLWWHHLRQGRQRAISHADDCCVCLRKNSIGIHRMLTGTSLSI